MAECSGLADGPGTTEERRQSRPVDKLFLSSLPLSIIRYVTITLQYILYSPAERAQHVTLQVETILVSTAPYVLYVLYLRWLRQESGGSDAHSIYNLNGISVCRSPAPPIGVIACCGF